ncbi:MAG: hypothetical protein HC850_05330 [Rhodomicrobium sp.]|nr:hypothetical protein [Rhodomicrobium sp.]
MIPYRSYRRPLAETKELLAGFYVIEAAHLNEAAGIDATIPPLAFGRIELHPVWEPDRA